jgi:hypothetical protein
MNEVFEELVTWKNNHDLLHPGEPFPGRIVVSCAPTALAARLADALRTASGAGYREVYFRLTTGETFMRPSFGRISRLKTTAARAGLEAQPGASAAVVPLGEPTGATCAQVVRQVVELRRAGREVQFSGVSEED